MSDLWTLTVVHYECRCDQCGILMPEGAELVYGGDPRLRLHRSCADKSEILYEPTRAWEKALADGRVAR